METKTDWAWLPELLLDSIIKSLILPVDYLRFGAVCKHWRSVAIEQNMHKICFNKVPMLMVPTKDSSKERRSLFDVTQGKNYGVELPIPFNRRCCGSSHGWLAFAMEDLVITLFNPFLGKQIDLPPILNMKKAAYNARYFVRKVVLSADPFKNPDDYEVVAIYGGMQQLAFIKGGQDSWARIPVDKTIQKKFVASDVIYYQGIIYAVNYHNEIMPGRVVSINTTTKAIIAVAQWKANSCSEVRLVQAGAYLVESSRGELLVVNRLLSHQYIRKISKRKKVGSTSRLQVFKLAKYEQKSMLVPEEVNDLGDDALFLGDNQSMSVLASDCPGCRPNSIYFTDDYVELFYPYGPRDMAIYNLKDESFESHYVPSRLHKRLPPPLWITTKRNFLN